MIRSKLAAGIVAAGTAVAIVNAPVVAAQEVGTPQHIGTIPTSSEWFFGGIQQLFSPDKYARQDGLYKVLHSPLFSSVDLSIASDAILQPLSTALK